MKTKNIYIIRHGETDYNKNSMVQGRGINASLNETGRQQAQLFYDMYKNIGFDKIYTSCLKRTKESVELFIKDGIAFEQLEGLDEISWGNHEGKPFNEHMHADYSRILSAWSDGRLDENVGGGESPIEVMTRQKKAMKQILSNTSENNILISTHGRAMRILLCHLLNYPLQFMDNFEHQNLCLYHLKYTGTLFSIAKNNSSGHLNSEF